MNRDERWMENKKLRREMARNIESVLAKYERIVFWRLPQSRVETKKQVRSVSLETTSIQKGRKWQELHRISSDFKEYSYLRDIITMLQNAVRLC